MRALSVAGTDYQALRQKVLEGLPTNRTFAVKHPHLHIPFDSTVKVVEILQDPQITSAQFDQAVAAIIRWLGVDNNELLEYDDGRGKYTVGWAVANIVNVHHFVAFEYVPLTKPARRNIRLFDPQGNKALSRLKCNNLGYAMSRFLWGEEDDTVAPLYQMRQTELFRTVAEPLGLLLEHALNDVKKRWEWEKDVVGSATAKDPKQHKTEMRQKSKKGLYSCEWFEATDSRNFTFDMYLDMRECLNFKIYLVSDAMISGLAKGESDSNRFLLKWEKEVLIPRNRVVRYWQPNAGTMPAAPEMKNQLGGQTLLRA